MSVRDPNRKVGSGPADLRVAYRLMEDSYRSSTGFQVGRCLFTSHLLFDGFVLRGRCAAADTDDGLAVYRRFARTASSPTRS